MHLDLIQAVSISGSAYSANDDRAGHGDRHAWVIDGATDLGEPGLVGPRGGAAWLALEADRAFAAAPDAPLEAMITAIAEQLATRFTAAQTRAPAGAWELPIAATLAVRLDGDALEAAWLGDCVGLHIRYERVRRFGAETESKEAEQAHAASLAAYHAGARVREAEVLASLRASRERPDRRILGVDPATARPFTDRLPIASGDELLLMTDGFAALMDVYAEFDAESLAATMRLEGLAAMAARLRAIEATDASCTRWPRFKVSDDATALWLRVA